MSERLAGKVKFFNTVKGFGFISRDDGGGDVFIHLNNLPAGVDELDEGDAVTFEVEPGKNGKGLRALKVAVVAILLLMVAASNRSIAKDVQVTFTDAEQQGLSTVPQAVKQCSADAAINSDLNMCRNLAMFLQGVLGKVQAAANAPAAIVAPPAAPAPPVEPQN